MTKSLKLFFDECASKKFPPRLLELYSEDYPHLETAHLADYYAKGTRDSEWIPMVAKEGWIVITADKGRSSQEKLPKLCEDFKVTYIIISGTLKVARLREAFFCIWPQIACVPLLPRGTRISLYFRSYKNVKLPSLEIGNKSLPRWCKDNDIELPSHLL